MRTRQQVDELTRQLSAAHKRIAELESRLEATSLHDGLTGLANAQTFGRRLDAEVSRARRHGRALTVAMLDLDGFRAVNRHHGHEVGDRILVSAADILTRFTRQSDTVGRIGADQFAVLLPETHGAEGVQCVERIQLELEAARVGPVESLSAAVGIAQYRLPLQADELMALAGQAMERARAEGGSRVETAGAAAGEEPERESTSDGAIAGLAEALLERDRYTGEHSDSVVRLVDEVARGLGLSQDEVDRVIAAAQLHDIGKVAMPDEILNKPGPLTADEWEVMRQHPVIGERILRAIPSLGPVARIVRHEHERFDGGGYPDGLSGDEIPLGSRIILACDAYHAMVSDRPYRKAMSHAEAIRELAEGAGTQFDPQVTELLIGSLYMGRQMGEAAPA